VGTAAHFDFKSSKSDRQAIYKSGDKIREKKSHWGGMSKKATDNKERKHKSSVGEKRKKMTDSSKLMQIQVFYRAEPTTRN